MSRFYFDLHVMGNVEKEKADAAERLKDDDPGTTKHAKELIEQYGQAADAKEMQRFLNAA